jgi:hypothetical protein
MCSNHELSPSVQKKHVCLLAPDIIRRAEETMFPYFSSADDLLDLMKERSSLIGRACLLVLWPFLPRFRREYAYHRAEWRKQRREPDTARARTPLMLVPGGKP